MAKPKALLLAHYDLDGAGCSVCADHIWDIVDRKHQGYGKVRASLGYLIGKYYKRIDTLVIADLKIEPEDLALARFAFKEVIYYDHHESSAELFYRGQDPKEDIFGIVHNDSDPIYVNYSLKYCSTALMWMDAVKNRGVKSTDQMSAFVNTINAYDLWNVDHARFETGAKLNDLFWHYHMDDFRNRFKDGFYGFTEYEVDLLNRFQNERKTAVETAMVETTDLGSKVVMLGDSKAINFVPSLMDGDIFYIISPAMPGKNVSMRLHKDLYDTFNVNNALQVLPISDDFLMSCGGHAGAGGLTFNESASYNDIVDFLFDHDYAMRQGGMNESQSEACV